MRYFLIIFLIIASRQLSIGQHNPTKYETVNKALTDIGYNVLKSYEYVIEKPITNVPMECYGGNRYFIFIQLFDNATNNLSMSLKNKDGKTYASGNDRLDIDLRFEHGKFELDLEIKATDYTKRPKILLVQAYRSINNATNDRTQNKEVKAYYTLDGLTEIENLQDQFEKQIKDYLSTEISKQGATLTKLVTASTGLDEKVMPYTFYRENAYLIYGYSSSGELASFKLVKPKEQKVNPFSGETITSAESTLISSTQGMITSNFIGQSPNLFNLGLSGNNSEAQYGGFIVYAIGYRSKDNQSSNASLNKPEKFYVR